MHRLRHDVLEGLLSETLIKAGCEPRGSSIVAESLVKASLRGTDSHGIRLFPHYLKALSAGRINGKPDIKIEQTSVSSWRVDGDSGYGQAVGRISLDHVVSTARDSGCSIVSVANSSHPGAMAPISMPLAKLGLIVLSFANADSLVNVPGATEAFFGTNPICWVGPRDGQQVCTIDMAISQVPWNMILSSREKGIELEGSYAYTDKGIATCNPVEANTLAGIGLYKGHALAAMVELMCGALCGGPVADQLLKMYSSPLEVQRKLSQTYIVINPEFLGGLKLFTEILEGMILRISKLTAINNHTPMMPGLKEDSTEELRMKTGIPTPVEVVELIEEHMQRHQLSLREALLR